MDQELEASRKVGNPECLHCRLIEAIYAHFEAKGSTVGDETLLDIREVAESVGTVLAEFFAGQDDKRERDRRLKELFLGIRDAIPGIRARGDGAFPKHIGLH